MDSCGCPNFIFLLFATKLKSTPKPFIIFVCALIASNAKLLELKKSCTV